MNELHFSKAHQRAKTAKTAKTVFCNPVRKTLAAALFTTLGMCAVPAIAQDLMAEGKKLFTQTAAPACSVCHTLKHAGAAGEIGPSLNELKPDAARVEKALRNGIGQMPAFASLTVEQIALLSKYVAAASVLP